LTLTAGGAPEAPPLRVLVAARPWARLWGLAGLRAPPPGDVALLLAPCRSVHTIGMRWPLDLVWLGPDGRVVRVDEDVGPWRARSCRAARAVLEVPGGRGRGRAVARQLRR
jgi:uncharacterized membrane protein (UPF0127 family)